MKCARCKDEMSPHHARRGETMCGVCQIVTTKSRFGVQTASLVPKHWNSGLGEEIEDYDHLKRRRKELVRDGVLESDGWE